MSVLSFLTLNAFVPKLCHVTKYLTFVKYEELVACITLMVSLKVSLPHVKFPLNCIKFVLFVLMYYISKMAE